MKPIVTERIALMALLLLLNVIPFDLVWGGRITDITQMRRLELISLAVHGLMLAVVAVKAGLIQVRVNPKLVQGVLWVMFGVFLLNTLANVASLNVFERFVFAPLTFLLALFTLRLVRTRRKPQPF